MASSDTTTFGNGLVGERYRLLRRLGETASGETWEAVDTRLDRPVLVRLLSEADRVDAGAQRRLRAVARQATLEERADSPRVLDGGDDPALGPFVVAELNEALDETIPLRTERQQLAARDSRFAAAPPGYGRGRGEPGGARRTGLFALAILLLAVVASAAFLARAVFAPAEEPVAAPTAAPTSEQAARLLARAQPDQPTAGPSVAPTIAAAAQPKPQPTSPPTAEPTLELTQQPTLRPATPSVQAQAAANPAGSPVDAIRQHYSLINTKNYSAGYQLMDSHLQSLNSPADYASWFANKVSIQPISIDLVSESGGQAVVRTVVSSTDRVEGADVRTQVSEQFVLINENGAWRIDKVTRL